MSDGNGKPAEGQPPVERVQAVAQVQVILTADGKLLLDCHGDGPMILAALVMAQHSLMDKIAPKVGPTSKITVPRMSGIRV